MGRVHTKFCVGEWVQKSGGTAIAYVHIYVLSSPGFLSTNLVLFSFGQFLGNCTRLSPSRFSPSAMLRLHRLLSFVLVGLVVGQELKKQGEASHRERHSYLFSGHLFAWSPSKAKPFSGNFLLPRKVLPNRLGTDFERERRCRRGANRNQCGRVHLCSEYLNIRAKNETQLTIQKNDDISADQALLRVLLKKGRFPHKQVLLDAVVDMEHLRLAPTWNLEGTIGSSGHTRLTIIKTPIHQGPHDIEWVRDRPSRRRQVYCKTHLRWDAKQASLYVPRDISEKSRLRSGRH